MILVLLVLLETSECGLFLDLAIAIKRKCPCTSPGVSARTTLLDKVFDFCSYTWTFRQNCTNSFTPSPFHKTLLGKSLLYLSHRISLYCSSSFFFISSRPLSSSGLLTPIAQISASLESESDIISTTQLSLSVFSLRRSQHRNACLDCSTTFSLSSDRPKKDS